jgi:hypothetical protein
MSYCSTLREFQDTTRPSEMYRRCIFLPADVAQPRWVWMKSNQLGDYWMIGQPELEKYVPGTSVSWGDGAFDCFRDGDRYLDYQIVVHRDWAASLPEHPDNACVKAFVGKTIGDRYTWRGPLLACSYKLAQGKDGRERQVSCGH